MNWYYANGGEKQGPVDQAAFDRLGAEGVIQQATLVWHEGLTDWQRYADTEPAMYCTECGKSYPTGFMLQYGTSWVCVNCKPRFAQKIREGALFASAIPYAGFWIRFGAYTVDNVILGIVSMATNFLLIGAMTLRRMDPAALFASMGAAYSAQFVISAAYYSLFVWKFGGTPGKLALGLRIVRPDGTPLSLGLSIGRYAATLVSNFTMGIGYAMAAIDEEKRALHDRLAGTRVIKPK
jgi:uncharacterized RDD family membrane protein YckC